MNYINKYKDYIVYKISQICNNIILTKILIKKLIEFG